MQRVIILRGAPSSGKSTIAKSYRNFDEKIAWLKVDNFKDFFADDASPALSYVNGSALATLEYLLQQGFSVVMDGIFQDPSAINTAVTIATINNIPVRVFQLEVSLEKLLERDKTREGVKEGARKQMPDEVITRIYTALKENPYKDAILLNTEENNLEECKKIIDDNYDRS
jgi:predicted kinase